MAIMWSNERVVSLQISKELHALLLIIATTKMTVKDRRLGNTMASQEMFCCILKLKDFCVTLLLKKE